jgi:glycosyltransferase involved in cell wall biosynthesis
MSGASRLTILYVGRLPPHPGGDAIVTAACLSGLAAHGHRVCALVPMTTATPVSAVASRRRHPRLRVEPYPVPFWFTARDMVFGDRDYREYTRAQGAALAAMVPGLVREEQPDLIVAGHEHLACHVAALARAAGVPCALVVHGGTTVQALAEPGGAAGELRRVIEDFEQADLVITVARHLAECLRQLGLRHVRAIPNAVDVRLFSRRPWKAAVRRRLGLGPVDVPVVHVSNLRAVKRPLDIVESAGLALRQDPRLVYVIVGDGPNRSAMEQAARAHGIRHRFRFTGWVEHARVADYLNLADIVVMPSAHEGLALVYLESQACGRVLVASDIRAAREAIVDGATGILFRKGDVAHLAEQTLRLAADPALRRAIGLRARTMAAGRSLDAAVAGYEAAFTEAVGLQAPGVRNSVVGGAGREPATSAL